jgi:hypothetical protein
MADQELNGKSTTYVMDAEEMLCCSETGAIIIRPSIRKPALITIQQARELAASLFQNEGSVQGCVIYKCPDCEKQWYKNGQKPDEKPPQFPKIYSGDCPVCGTALKSRLPF